MPNAKDGPIRGLQLWVNLAREFKMVEPEYQEHSPDEIVTKSKNGVKVKGMKFINTYSRGNSSDLISSFSPLQ